MLITVNFVKKLSLVTKYCLVIPISILLTLRVLGKISTLSNLRIYKIYLQWETMLLGFAFFFVFLLVTANTVPITNAEIYGVVIEPHGEPSIKEAQRCLSIFEEARDHFEEKRYLKKFMIAHDGRDNLKAWLKARNANVFLRKYWEASKNLRKSDENEFERYFSLCYEKYQMEQLDYFTNNGILSPK